MSMSTSRLRASVSGASAHDQAAPSICGQTNADTGAGAGAGAGAGTGAGAGAGAGATHVDGRNLKRRRDRDRGSEYNSNRKDAKRGCKPSPTGAQGSAGGAPGAGAGTCEYTVLHTSDEVVRYVTPYVHTFSTYAKGRWLGREVQEVLSREFGSYPASYWGQAFSQGFVQVNNLPVDGTERFQNGDYLTHTTHRHEPPVMGSPELVGIRLQVQVQVQPDAAAAAETAETAAQVAATAVAPTLEVDLLAICKPASLPMHPCGSYRFNSLLNILESEPLFRQQPNPVHLVHRLDRVTSGLVVLAGTKDAAHRVSQQILHGQTTKYYVARVRGKYLAQEQEALRSMPPLLGAEIQTVRSCGEAAEDGDAEPGTGDTSRSKPPSQQPWKSAGKGKGKGKAVVDNPAEVVDITAPITRAAVPLETVRAAFGESGKVGCGHDESMPGWLLVHCPIGIISHREGMYISMRVCACVYDDACSMCVSISVGNGHCITYLTTFHHHRPLTIKVCTATTPCLSTPKTHSAPSSSWHTTAPATPVCCCASL